MLSGRFTADGNAIERIDIHRLRLGDSDLAGTVARRAGGGWRADIHAAGARCAAAAEKSKGGSAADESDAADDPSDTAPLAVNARIGRLLLGPEAASCARSPPSCCATGGEWRSAQIDAQYPDGGALWLRLGEAGDGRRLMFQSDDLGAALKLLDVTDTVIGGRLRIDGQLSREAGKQVLRAHLEGEDYKVKNSSTALRVLSLPSLTGIASALSGSGLPFSTLRGDIVYRDGVLSIEKALGYGESIGVTAPAGSIPGATGTAERHRRPGLRGEFAARQGSGDRRGIRRLARPVRGRFPARRRDRRPGGRGQPAQRSRAGRSARAFLPDYRLPEAAARGRGRNANSKPVAGVSHSGVSQLSGCDRVYSVRATSSMSKHSITSPTWMSS